MAEYGVCEMNTANQREDDQILRWTDVNCIHREGLTVV